jgi:RNA polymerase sigma factor (sigma-70 family)
VESWRVELAAGNADAAWDRFLEAYRSLILATIRHTITDSDAVMDVFAHVCGQLAANELERLRAYERRSQHTAKFSSWLVVVVRHVCIDWLRRQHGRPRARVPDGLSDLGGSLFQLIFVEHHSHYEAYERIRATSVPDLSFSGFLKELRQVYLVAGSRRSGAARSARGARAAMMDESPSAERRLESEEANAALQAALRRLAPEQRLAVQLYVLDDVPAAEVARLLGWPNAKAVYNGVYRALAVLREELLRAGISSAGL